MLSRDIISFGGVFVGKIHFFVWLNFSCLYIICVVINIFFFWPRNHTKNKSFDDFR